MLQKRISFFCGLLLSLLTGCINVAENRCGEALSFDEGWLFHRGDISGGEKMCLPDSGWRKLDVPHDWSIEDIPDAGSPFADAIPNGVASGFTVGGIGWYRKHFTLDRSNAGKRVFIRFDGVYMDADILINEKQVGSHFYGYSSFGFDITDFVSFDEENIIAVRVANETVKSRWYSGSGIYRHVWLTIASPLHIDRWGTAVTTSEMSTNKATIAIASTLVNQFPENKTACIGYEIRDKDMETVAQGTLSVEIAGGQEETLRQYIEMCQPHLWSVETPYLYTLETKVMLDDRLVDHTTTVFGVRTVQFDAEHGFRLNGKTLKLKGGCIHHDNGPLGTIALARAEERKVACHKAAGFNALRMAHNPPSPEMLDACDRLGMLVIDEAFDVWREGHFTDDYGKYFDQLWQSDLESMILRDRNHPAIIMWSIGNEIKNSQTAEMAELCGTMSAFVKAIDATRPVTAAVNAVDDGKATYLSHLDVCGYNYARERYLQDHHQHPERLMYGSESFAGEAYDCWQAVEKYPWVIGDFVWTSFDYIGEASIGWRGYPQELDFYPWHLAYCGDLDICGNRRPQSYFRQTLWDEQPVVAIFVTPPTPSFPLNPKKATWSVWDWPDVISCWNFEGCETKLLEIVVYTQCEEVELSLNGKSFGKRKNLAADKNVLRWRMPYLAGELKATGFKGGKEAASSVLKTAGTPVAIRLTADRQTLLPTGEDLSYVKVELTDADGVRNPIADRLALFELEGAGKLAATANADPMCTDSFQQRQCKTWRGECMAVVRSGKENGAIRLTVKVDGLPDASIIFNASMLP
jgi:beta-galactosidase